MHRGNIRAQQKADFKRPPKQDWRAKLYENQKNAPEAAQPIEQPQAAFLPERAINNPGILPTLLMLGLVGNMVVKAQVQHELQQPQPLSRFNK